MPQVLAEQKKSLFRITPYVMQKFSHLREPELQWGFSKEGALYEWAIKKLGHNDGIGYLEAIKKIHANIAEQTGGNPKQAWGDYVGHVVEGPLGDPQTEFDFENVSGRKIEAFIKSFDATHPGAEMADTWRTTHKMKFLTWDQFEETIGDSTMTMSVKLDGENVCVYFENGRVALLTNKGTMRTGLPATEEAEKVLTGKYKKAAFMGELYAVDEAGKPISYMKAVPMLKDPNQHKDNQLRLSIFDIVELDGVDYLEYMVDDKMKTIDTLFGKGTYVRPATIIKGGIKEAQEAWSQLEEKGWEGLIAHTAMEIYKIKPVHSYDMAVVAVTKSPKFPDRIGAMLVSFLDKEGRFRFDGYIGGGLTDHERIEFMDWAQRNKVSEDSTQIWVDPFKEPMVVEIESLEVNVKKQPAAQFNGGKWVTVEDQMAGTLRFPRLKQVREDKTVRYQDVPVEQIGVEASAHIVQASELRIGAYVETHTGHRGTVITDVSDSGDVVVQWDKSLYGVISASEVHYTEIKRTCI